MKTLNFFVLLLISFFFTGCYSSKNECKKIEEKNLVGNAKDEHGCLLSAGYQWSNLLKDCIRPFEKGIRLEDVLNTNSTSVTYLVFNADSSKVEVFAPLDNGNVVLNKIKDRQIWKNNNYVVRKNKGKWIFEENKK